ncbi:hypothetical protein N7457_007988 [Penicillium paradoxum]|uniref:uncharacterized protein n=1 Tax=Penicillium paradoxum TaxID=176176 RepID=UPI0025497F65|nr:uncharacterized protein N7457_007988 [Penicillium paradoxum]KAJ5773092.1 hypothetical protein N7457_007988 [Penicillium paradoxum]
MLFKYGFNDRELDHPAGRVLGGSSAINGMAYTPPSPAGIDAWAQLGNPRWNWQSLRPYLRKSHTLNLPQSDSSTGERENYSSHGPIEVVFPALNDEKSFPLANAWKEAFRAQGYEHSIDAFPENRTIGTRDYMATINPVSGHHSSGDSEYGRLAAQRANVIIITSATVHRIIFSSSSDTLVATGAEFERYGATMKIQATKEVILAAGAFNTPKLLELSGIGGADRLDHLGIKPLIDQPAVGENLQNHLTSMVTVPLKTHPDIDGISPGVKGVAFARLDPEEQTNLFWGGPKPTSPSDWVIRSLLHSRDEASAVFLMAVIPGNMVILGVIASFPFSRGHCHIKSADPNDMSTIDGQYFSHDLDIEILARHVQTLHHLTKDPALQEFLQPSTALTDLETIKTQLREETASSCHHGCGTAAMLPQEAGGVVDQDLKVYGTKNLRIVDASIFPLITNANPITTVYAVAERAADIIRSK